MSLESSPATRIQLCGPTVLEQNGQRLEGRLPGRQGRHLFAYLVCNRHRPTGRAELIDALWPRQPPAAADSGLNALVSKLRKLLGPETVEGRATLQLRLGQHAHVDVEVAADAVHRAESQVALEDWARAWGPALVALLITEREFLAGEDAPWIDERRRQLADIHLRALEAYGTAALGMGGTELPAAVRAARQLISAAPLRERGYQVLMHALAQQGNVAEALRVYTELCDLLRDELGVSPSPSSTTVYETLLRT